MICDICRRRFLEKSEQGIYSHYKSGEPKAFEHHYHLCKECCKVVNATLKGVLFKGMAKYLPDKRKFK